MEFNNTFSYKLIYIFCINDENHKGLLKIGDTSVDTDTVNLEPTCNILNQAAHKRIRSYTNITGVSYQLLYTELAVRVVNRNGKQKTECFRDHLVHQVLKRSGIPNHYFDKENKRNEWFKTDLATAIHAIKAVKEDRPSLDPNEKSQGNTPIIWREEQEQAFDQTVKRFKKGNHMLWNAKMRFGKTLTALRVIKEFPFKKVLVYTHRPVVLDSWQSDFEKLIKDGSYKFASRKQGYNLKELQRDNYSHFIYFASMQDLRGSATVGGNFDKNDEVFTEKWDLIIIDEAHEGTQTVLGKRVLQDILNHHPEHPTKLLQLSGTPFNLLDNFEEEEVFSWDYIKEQDAKKRWLEEHFGDSNPYEELPRMEIYTYNLNREFSSYTDLDDKAFNFKEFFRTWTGDVQKDYKRMPPHAKIGDFVHEGDVKKFLDLLTNENTNSNYPFSTEKYRQFFRHTLWMVPGVKEAKALSKLLREHPIFGNKQFYKIANVAGDGDEEKEYNDALKEVRAAIGENPDDHYSITLSCGRLTTGVTIPEWTGVLMLAGSFSTSAANYMQTIFRVQTPANINGRMKERCCVFDFAPDRTLKMVAEASQVSAKAGKTSDTDRAILRDFLNFCPVISVQGSKMEQYEESTLFQQLKKAYTDRVVKNGFDDKHLYNDNLLKLDDLELEEFEHLKKIVKNAKLSMGPQNDIEMNSLGFTEEEYDKVKNAEKKPKKELTSEEKALLEEKRKKQENARKAISILRAISIRIPLLIYGAKYNMNKDISIEEDISPKKFVELIDDQSWEEFMPQDVTKNLFLKFSKYYDVDVFIAAGKQIRARAKAADELSPTERVQKLANLFATFKNPDKETVLTPWRVVNMHLGECLGGYNFYDEKFEKQLEEPRVISHGKVTEDTLANPHAHILEINSKTGLYPLYATYSIYRAQLEQIPPEQRTLEKQNQLWLDTVRDNIFVICKTKMAKYITQRTLLGYKNGEINTHYFEDLINQLKNKPEQFRSKVLKGSFWNRKENVMQFDAVVGNPPYQESKAKTENQTQGNSSYIYQFFQLVADNLAHYTCLIYPFGGWFDAPERLNGLGNKILKDKHTISIYAYEGTTDKRAWYRTDKAPCPIFGTDANLSAGIAIVLRDKDFHEELKYSNRIYSDDVVSIKYDEQLELTPNPVFIVINKKLGNRKINSLIKKGIFGIESDWVEKNPTKVSFEKADWENPVQVLTNDKAGSSGRAKLYWTAKRNIPKGWEYINFYKVIMTSAYPKQKLVSGVSTLENVQRRISELIELMPEGTAFGRSRLALFMSKDKKECENFITYTKTKFFSGLVLQEPNRRSSFGDIIPMQDFTDKSDIDWSKPLAEIDKQLYKKYGLTQKEIDFIENENMIKPME